MGYEHVRDGLATVRCGLRRRHTSPRGALGQRHPFAIAVVHADARRLAQLAIRSRDKAQRKIRRHTEDVAMIFAAAEGVTFTPAQVWATLIGAASVIAFLYRALIVSKDRESNQVLLQKDAAIAELVSIKKSYEEVAQDAIKSATATVNHYRQKEGKPPMIPIAPVISESHSPSTAKQRETARIATMRATMANIRLLSGQIPRAEPERAIEFKPPLGVE